MNGNTKLDIILGPMFSGKTTKLLEIMDVFDKQNIKYMAVKPHIDNRYTENDNNNFIISHNLKKRECKVSSNLKDVFANSFKNKIAYKIIEKDLKVFRDQMDPDEYNGASLLGLNGISIKSHGSANPYAFSCAINKCYEFILNDLNKKIVGNFKL